MNILRLTTMFFLLFAFNANGQNIKIGDNSTAGDPSAVLELDGSNGQGFLTPQISTDAIMNSMAASLPTTAEGLIVYRTSNANTQYEEGMYYWEGDRWIKYKPFGFSGIVGTNWDTLASPVPNYTFSSTDNGFTGSVLGVGEYQVLFDTPFNSYPIITLTPENNKFPLPEGLPVPDVSCTPSFSANCTGDFNSDQTEAVRIVSTVQITSAGGPQTQVIQHGVGYLPSLNSATVPGGYTNDTSTPEFVSASFDANGCSWPQSWMTGTPPSSTGTPPPAANASALAGGCYGSNTDCILQVADPCYEQNGGGNYGRIIPPLDLSVPDACVSAYHPPETIGSNQDSQLTIRIGDNAADHFEIYVESSPHWSDAMAAFIDWNRDGDFSDAGEFLGQVNPPPCTAGQGQQTSGCNGSAQVGANANTSPFIQNATPGQFTFPTDPSIAVDYGLTNLRIYSTWTGGSNSNPTLWDEPCRTSTWGETEDFIVELYDDVGGSVVGLGNNFSFTPAICGTRVLGTVGNYTGFQVECSNIVGNPIETKVHFDVTKNTVY